MTALSSARNTAQLGGPNWIIKAPVKAGAVIYNGAMVGKSSGYWVPASTTVVPLGIADLQDWDDQTKQGQQSTFAQTSGQKVDNSAGSNGDRKINVRRGTFKMNNKGGDLVTDALIGDVVYVEDDNTVRLTASGSVIAGILAGFDDDGKPFVSVGGGTALIAFAFGEA